MKKRFGRKGRSRFHKKSGRGKSLRTYKMARGGGRL